MKYIQQSVMNRVATLTIDRQEALNALNKEVIEELSSAIGNLETDAEVRVIIITGAGHKAFVAGADIKEFENYTQDQGEELSRKGQEMLFDKIANLKKPVIAAINGYALGGGLELALACHIRFASDNALLGLPEVTLGLIPGYGGTQRLPKQIGLGRAFEMILTGKPVDANTAYEIGLINSIEAPELLLVETQNLAEIIANNSPSALNAAIKATNASYDYEKGFAKEQKHFGELFQTPDFKTGVSAFLNKEKPNF